MERYTAHMAFIQPTALPDAIQGVFDRSPGCDWQDVGGQINILTDVNRTPVHTFFCDPTSSAQRSNIVRDGFEIVRKPPDQRPNYFRYGYRDDAEAYLLRKYGSVDRPSLRDALGGLLVDAGLVQFGVMSASLAERIMETKARLQSDLDIQYDIEAFIDSLHVAKGDFVFIVDPIAGYTESTPAKGVVVEEGFNFPLSGIDTRKFKINVIANDWYSDTYHGTVRPAVPPPINPGFFTAPPFVADVDLTTSVFDLPDASRQVAIQGLVTFNPAAGQRGRVWWKRLGLGKTFTANATSNGITSAAHGFVNTDRVEVATIAGVLPGGLAADIGYYVVSATTNTLQLSLTSGGAAIDLTSAETGVVKLFPQTAYQQVESLLYPSPDTQQAGFEVRPVIGGWHQFKVVTEQSASGISQPFALHPRWYLDVVFQPSSFNLVDCVLLRDVDGFDHEGIGFYWWAQPETQDGRLWLGAKLFVNRNGSYQELATVTQPGNSGTALSPLPDWPYDSVIDDVSELYVDLPSNVVLESVTEAQMFAGRNKALLGNGLNFEVIHFQSAVFQSTSGGFTRWRLRTFLRGVRGSEFALNNHVADEIFIPITDAVKFIPFDLTQLNNELTYKAVTFGTDIVDATEQNFTWTGGAGKPLGPAIAGQWDELVEDCLITLTPRLRVGGTTFTSGFATPQTEKRLFIMFTDAVPPRIQMVTQRRETPMILVSSPIDVGLVSKVPISAANSSARVTFIDDGTGFEHSAYLLLLPNPKSLAVQWAFNISVISGTAYIEAADTDGLNILASTTCGSTSVIGVRLAVEDGIVRYYLTIDTANEMLFAESPISPRDYVLLRASIQNSHIDYSNARQVSGFYDFLYTEEMRNADGLSAIGVNELLLEAWEDSGLVGRGWSNEKFV